MATGSLGEFETYVAMRIDRSYIWSDVAEMYVARDYVLIKYHR